VPTYSKIKAKSSVAPKIATLRSQTHYVKLTVLLVATTGSRHNVGNNFFYPPQLNGELHEKLNRRSCHP
jgi:hypothetical protein